MTRCTCATGPYSHGTVPEVCPAHGQRTKTTGDAAPGGRGVPVVDLSTTVADLRMHATVARHRAQEALRDAALVNEYLLREASYLDSLADTLDGKG